MTLAQMKEMAEHFYKLGFRHGDPCEVLSINEEDFERAYSRWQEHELSRPSKYVVSTTCEYSTTVLARSEAEALEKAAETHFSTWQLTVLDTLADKRDF